MFDDHQELLLLCLGTFIACPCCTTLHFREIFLSLVFVVRNSPNCRTAYPEAAFSPACGQSRRHELPASVLYPSTVTEVVQCPQQNFQVTVASHLLLFFSSPALSYVFNLAFTFSTVAHPLRVVNMYLSPKCSSTEVLQIFPQERSRPALASIPQRKSINLKEQ